MSGFTDSGHSERLKLLESNGSKRPGGDIKRTQLNVYQTETGSILSFLSYLSSLV
jgi:hypothetical protein